MKRRLLSSFLVGGFLWAWLSPYACYGDTYLLLRVKTPDSPRPPTWLHLTSGKWGAYHVEIKDSIVFSKQVHSGWYAIDHVDFTEHWKGSVGTIFIKSRPAFEVDRHTVHYAGEYVIRQDGTVSISANPDTIRELCEDHNELLSSHVVVMGLPVKGSHKITIGKPCG